jgi:hypothetical protein
MPGRRQHSDHNRRSDQNGTLLASALSASCNDFFETKQTKNATGSYGIAGSIPANPSRGFAGASPMRRRRDKCSRRPGRDKTLDGTDAPRSHFRKDRRAASGGTRAVSLTKLGACPLYASGTARRGAYRLDGKGRNGFRQPRALLGGSWTAAQPESVAEPASVNCGRCRPCSIPPAPFRSPVTGIGGTRAPA